MSDERMAALVRSLRGEDATAPSKETAPAQTESTGHGAGEDFTKGLFESMSGESHEEKSNAQPLHNSETPAPSDAGETERQWRNTVARLRGLPDEY